MNPIKIKSRKKKRDRGRRAHSTVNYGGESPRNSYNNSNTIIQLNNIRPKNARRSSKKLKELKFSNENNKKTAKLNNITSETNGYSKKNRKNLSKKKPRSLSQATKKRANSSIKSRPYTPQPSISVKIHGKGKKKTPKRKQKKFSQEIFNSNDITPTGGDSDGDIINTNDDGSNKNKNRLIEFDLLQYKSRDDIKAMFNIFREELDKQESILLNKVTDVDILNDGNNSVNGNHLGSISDLSSVVNVSKNSDDDEDITTDDYKSPIGDDMYSKLENFLSSDSSEITSPRFANMKINKSVEVNIKKPKKNKSKKVRKKVPKINVVTKKSDILYIDKDGTVEHIKNIGLKVGKTYEELIQEQNKQINKLKQILEYEAQATKEHQHVLELRKIQENKMKIANEKKLYVEDQLRKVQPLVERAKEALKQISRAEVDELRALRAPPTIAHTVLNCVIFVIYGKKPKKNESWQDVRKLVTYKTIKDIINFDTLNMVETDGNKKIQYVIKKFISDDQFTVERANLASKILGPCISWVEAQLKYAGVLNEIKPMLDEIKQLQKKIQKSNEEIERTTKLSQEISDEIKKCRGEMLEMIGYVRVGDRYYN